MSFVDPSTDFDSDGEVEGPAEPDTTNSASSPYANDSIYHNIDTPSRLFASDCAENRPPYRPPDTLLDSAGVIPDHVTTRDGGLDPLPDHDLLEGNIAALQDLLDSYQRRDGTGAGEDFTSIHAASPSQHSASGIFSTHGSSLTYPTVPRTTQQHWSMSNAREAQLFHHYIVRLSPWVSNTSR